MRTLWLHGRLAEMFGKSFSMQVKTPGQAFRLLDANLKGAFFRAIREGSYYVYCEKGGKEIPLPLSELGMSMAGDFHVVPELVGSSGSGTTNVGLAFLILGVGLIVAGTFTAGATTPVGVAMISYGIGFSITGAALLLMRLPKDDIVDSNTDINERASFAFNGPINTAKEGGPVPLVYGQMLVGSVLLSGSVFNIKEPI